MIAFCNPTLESASLFAASMEFVTVQDFSAMVPQNQSKQG